MKENINYEDYISKIRITIDKKELKLLLELHGTIGLDCYVEDLMQNIKKQIMEIE